MSIETMTKITTLSFSGIATNFAEIANIPQSYTDLKIMISARSSGTTANQAMYMQFRGANYGDLIYQTVVLRNSGTSVDSYATSVNANALLQIEIPNENNTSNTFSNIEIYIPNYTSNKFKTLLIDQVREHNHGTNFNMNSIRSGIW
jgi:hypothetical protein